MPTRKMHPHRKIARKTAAEARATERAARTPAQQAARLDAAGHVAKKERARLAKAAT